MLFRPLALAACRAALLGGALTASACASGVQTRPAPQSTPAPAAAAAPPAAAAARDSLPAARDVIARYVAAIGGRDAVMRHSSIRSVGTFEMPAAGIKGDMVVVQSPDKFVMTMNIPGVGQMLTGYDGAAGWSVDPVQGPRVLEGKELAQIREDAGFAAILRNSEHIRSMQTVERTTLGGRPCYMLKLTYASGRETRECYSTETGLLVGMITKQQSPMGEMEVTTLVGDWKEFGGLRSATTMRQQTMGQEQVMTVTSIEFDRPDDLKAFEPPAAIRAILQQQKRP